MLKYQIYQSQLKGSTAFGKWYARVVSDQTLGVSDLAAHMNSHHTPFSAGTIKGILEDAIDCTKELLLGGKRVQWDGLASFGTSIEHTMGAPTADDFSVAKHVKSVKLTAQGIGSFSKSVLTGKANLRETKEYVSPRSGGSGTTAPTLYTVSLSAGAGGTVSGGGQYEAGTVVEITAEAEAGYTFEKWSDGDMNATRSITVNGDIELSASFKQNGGDFGDMGA